MEISTLKLISSPERQLPQTKENEARTLLKRGVPHHKIKITCEKTGRIQGHFKREGEHCYQPIALKGLPGYLAKEAIEKTTQMLESSYVKLQGNHLDIMQRGLGGIPPKENVPACFICPISHEIMETPVVTPCGHTFEKVQLLQWVNNGHSNCPTCPKDLILNSNPNNWSINYAIKNQIDEWMQKSIEPVYPKTLSENPTPIDAAKSNLLLQLAKHCIEQKNYSEAIKQYEEAIKNTDNIEPYVEYVQLLLKADYPLKASKAFVYLARCYQKGNNHQEVVNAYQEAIQLQPENKDFLEEFARHLEEVEDKEEAVHCYETLIEISKKEEEPFLALAKYYKKLIELKPNELRHYEAYRTLLKANGQKKEAEEIKKKITEMQGITWSDPETALLKKKVEKLKKRNAILKEEVFQLKAAEQKLETAMQTLETRIVIRLNGGSKEENDGKQQRINSLINAISDEIGRKVVRNAVEILYKNDPQITKLKLQSSKIGNEGARALAEALEGNQTLQQLKLKANQIDVEGAEAIANAIEKTRQIPLQKLILVNNQITSKGLLALAKAIENNPQIPLQKLILSNNQIGTGGILALTKAIENNPHIPLRQLSFGSNHVGYKGALALAKMIENNPQIPLQSLNLPATRIDDDAVMVLARVIENNPQIPLQQLNFTYNQIGNTGATALANTLKKNQSLQKLHLDRNKIGDVGTQALAKAIENNPQIPLQELHLRFNPIGTEGGQALIRMIENNPELPLRKLPLSKNLIDSKILAKIQQLLEHKQTTTPANPTLALTPEPQVKT